MKPAPRSAKQKSPRPVTWRSPQAAETTRLKSTACVLVNAATVVDDLLACRWDFVWPPPTRLRDAVLMMGAGGWERALAATCRAGARSQRLRWSALTGSATPTDVKVVGVFRHGNQVGAFLAFGNDKSRSHKFAITDALVSSLRGAADLFQSAESEARPALDAISHDPIALNEHFYRFQQGKARMTLPLLPTVNLVRLPPTAADADDGLLAALTELQLVVSGQPPARDGEYALTVMPLLGSGMCACIAFVPAESIPAYGEVRAAVEIMVPRAFAKPRTASVTPPYFRPSGTIFVSSAVDTVQDLSPSELEDAWRAPDSQTEQRAADAAAEAGWEAAAWYQPHHEFTEDCWGVYLHAERITDIGISMGAALGARGVPPHLGLWLAVQMVYAHEMFHARVEAASTAIELSASRPRYRRYTRDVYGATKFTETWREEALANWQAREDVASMLSRKANNWRLTREHVDAAIEVIEAEQDRHPAGNANGDLGTTGSLGGSLPANYKVGNPTNRPREVFRPRACYADRSPSPSTARTCPSLW